MFKIATFTPQKISFLYVGRENLNSKIFIGWGENAFRFSLCAFYCLKFEQTSSERVPPMPLVILRPIDDQEVGRVEELDILLLPIPGRQADPVHSESKNSADAMLTNILSFKKM